MNDLRETAMCLWEEVLSAKGQCQDVTDAFEAQGTSVIRNQIGDMAEACDADYRASDFEGCFDWEFVPEWVAKNVQFDEHGATRK